MPAGSIVVPEAGRHAHPMTELAHRKSNGLEVSLLWSPRTGRLVVAVSDDRTEESFTVEAPRDCALDVYNHPFAYHRTERNQ
jgi:hypothetical protein